MSENLLNNETSSAGYPFDRMETATEIVFGGRISGTLASATDEGRQGDGSLVSFS